MKTRQNLIDLLKPFLTNHPHVLAVWEGGSAATDHLDAYSDLDLMVVVERADTSLLFGEIEQQLAHAFGIKERYRVPEPAWHGFSQCFYQFETTAPWLYLDLCLLPPDLEDRFTASDRHGIIEPWKDTIGFIDNRPTALDAIEHRAKTCYRRAVSGEFVLRLEVEKALHRAHLVDAQLFLHGYLMRHLAPLLNLEHRKTKVDFGIRYAKRDYAPDDYMLVSMFFQAATCSALANVAAAFFVRFNQLKQQYKAYSNLD